jgi:hypothetical protein
MMDSDNSDIENSLHNALLIVNENINAQNNKFYNDIFFTTLHIIATIVGLGIITILIYSGYMYFSNIL